MQDFIWRAVCRCEATRLARALSSAFVLMIGLMGAALAQAPAGPAKVIVGAYINRISDVNFKDNKVSIDLFMWFRWEPVGVLEDYKPLETLEIVNGYLEDSGKSSKVEKTIVGTSYASARMRITVYHNWNIEAFPFDRHKIVIHIEDSALDAKALEFQVDDPRNSGLSTELVLPGWQIRPAAATAARHVYQSNFGDDTRGVELQSEYSRVGFGIDMSRKGLGTPVKVLTTVIMATLVAFVAFGIRPSDVDPRFGLGIGALFAVTASSYVVASIAPDSDVLTIADRIHIVAIFFIVASLVVSVFSLKWEEAGTEVRWRRLDACSMILFPLLFIVAVGVCIGGAYMGGGVP